MKKIKISLTSVGRFHYFDLARELMRNGNLARLYTGYPYWKIDQDLRESTRSFPFLVTPQMALYRYGLQSFADQLSKPACNLLDHWVAGQLADCDVFSGLSQSILYTIRAAKKRGIKTVCERGSAHIVTQNEILIEEYQRYKIPFNGIQQWAIEKELEEYEEADLIKVISTFAKNTFLEQGILPHKIVNIPLGVNISLFHPFSKEDSTFRVLTVGTMNLQKGIPYLLEATRGLTKYDIETVLIGAFNREIKVIFDRYANTFSYKGIFPRSQLNWHYSQASVFVLASVQDGFGAVIAQAMACGLPVIATTNTGAADIITDGVEGFIVPIRDSQAIREKILFLYEHPDIREQMGQAALRRVQSLGGWERHGKLTIAAFEALASS